MIAKKESPHSTRNALYYTLATLLGGAGVFASAYFVMPAFTSVSYFSHQEAAPTSDNPSRGPDQSVGVVHLPTPTSLKAIYMSQCVVGTPSFRDSLVKFIDDTDLNAVVIDIRDYTGKISFPTDNPALADAVSDECGARDMQKFIATLHEKNIYIIGRITAFQNPYYATLHPELAVQKVGGGVWHDYKGLAFIDVGAKPYWDNVVELSKVSYALGFDELNFDYLRFPSDGPMKEADYSWDKDKNKSQALEEFFQYLHAQLKPTGVILSADLFGYVTVHEDDLGIGQVLERAMPYFDYIDPMVYPSHYNNGFAGLANVNSDPYKVVKVSLDTAVARALATTTAVYAVGETPIASTTPQLYKKPVFPASIIRPWLQSFDYPVVYTQEMVQAQIQASQDAGLDSYLVWDAANKYNALRKVLAATSTTP